eukprot:scaffold7755_cov104-Cylindrotheca_fusiformis.AAC.15
MLRWENKDNKCTNSTKTSDGLHRCAVCSLHRRRNKWRNSNEFEKRNAIIQGTGGSLVSLWAKILRHERTFSRKKDLVGFEVDLHLSDRPSNSGSPRQPFSTAPQTDDKEELYHSKI